ncbi:MAG: glycerophosphodiester phosphodiesterase [Chthoniobacteraceae bacterium]|nr:glycerophosphodiester phosphodiesterase [Chthoniobacteraceae bacterium]
MTSFLCIGHRGARGHEPENTLRSIRRAFELGAHGVEIDVWRAANQLVVIHDATLQRTTNGRGSLTRHSFAELRALDAGKGEQIPTLREVFETVDRRGLINVELKGRGTAHAVCELIEEFVRERGWTYDQFIVSSFHRRELKQIIFPGIRIGILCVRPSPLYYLSARRLHAFSIHPSATSTTPRFVEDAHRRGLKVLPYTVNSPAEIARMRALGVDGIFTDFPDRVRPA